MRKRDGPPGMPTATICVIDARNFFLARVMMQVGDDYELHVKYSFVGLTHC